VRVLRRSRRLRHLEEISRGERGIAPLATRDSRLIGAARTRWPDHPINKTSTASRRQRGEPRASITRARVHARTRVASWTRRANRAHVCARTQPRRPCYVISTCARIHLIGWFLCRTHRRGKEGFNDSRSCVDLRPLKHIECALYVCKLGQALRPLRGRSVACGAPTRPPRPRAPRRRASK